jgi:hypothetical protein
VKQLNGWQRVWIVFSAAWVIALGVLYVSSHQSDEKMYHDWANDLIAYLIEQSPDLRGHTVTSVRSKYSDLSDKQLVDALHEKYLPEHPAYSYGFAEIDSRYRTDGRVHVGAHAFDSRVGWLATALGLPVLLYLAGFSIAWIRAGFHHI